jgi:uncharacterized protein (TIGR02246 family)
MLNVQASRLRAGGGEDAARSAGGTPALHTPPSQSERRRLAGWPGAVSAPVRSHRERFAHTRVLTNMTRTIFLAALLCTLLVPSAFAEKTDAVQQVRQLEREWLDAYEKHDSAAMQRIVADDFSIVFPDGSGQTKAGILTMLERARASSRPSPRFTTEDVQARAYGDTVILSGRVITHMKRADGSESRQESRYTDTYVKLDGRWQVVASHLSNVPAKK